MAANELGQRVAVAAVGVPIAVVLIYFGGWPLGVVVAVLAALAARELYGLAGQKGTRAFTPFGMLLAGAIVLLSTTFRAEYDATPFIWLFVFVSTLALGGAAIWMRGTGGRPLEAVAVTVFAAVFVGGALSYVLFLRHLSEANASVLPWRGAALVAFPFMLAWVGDTCAYFGGRAWGRRKLIPSVSPGKTVEGAIANLVGTVLVGAVYASLVFQWWQGLPIGPLEGALAGAVVSPAAQIGDLAESLFKREAGVKDSGRLFPGHGGVLDRFDSVFFAVPAAYWYLAALLPLWIEGLPWR
jgi:phosphatidate cytidylyltransferase